MHALQRDKERQAVEFVFNWLPETLQKDTFFHMRSRHLELTRFFGNAPQARAQGESLARGEVRSRRRQTNSGCHGGPKPRVLTVPPGCVARAAAPRR